MNKNEQEIFEKYAKMNEALRIAKDALNEIKYLPESTNDQAQIMAACAINKIDEVLK